jgi:hypothetical protein
MESILDFLKRKELFVLESDWDSEHFELPFELKPKDFIGFAMKDLKGNDDRSLVNAISNIKRGIDCRIESLLYLFGSYEKVKKENWNFPKKTEFLSRINVVAPQILHKINRERNRIEHDFKKPKRGEVEDFLDVANLFLLYTSPFLVHRNVSITLCLKDERDLDYQDTMTLTVDSKKGILELGIWFKRKFKETKVSIDDEENYIRFLKYWIWGILNR